VVLAAGEIRQLGQVERTPRAFWQDAWEAMRGDIVRALVEYVTNADDAYARRGGKGRILIEVEHRRGDEPWIARVRDRATGMSLAEMHDRIGRQGGRTSGFDQGAAVRGNLGLGSKDPACFGRVVFESIKNGEFAWYAIDDQGERSSSAKPKKVTPEMRAKLGIPTNGTVVTLEVRHPVSCPRHDTLKSLLSQHVLLRDIMRDPDRDAFLLHGNKPGARPDRLRFELPKLTTRVDKTRAPLPGYGEATADIYIGEADETFPDEGRRSPTRKAGLLIKGRRAIYESTLFGFEGNPYALAFAGWIKSDDIDRIADEFDSRAEKGVQHPPDNPMPIISRRRQGLVEEHPLYQAIKRLAEAELAPLVAEREQRARQRSRTVEQESTTRLLSQLARAAARFMQEAAEEEDLDLDLTSGTEPTPPLTIIPGAVEMPAGSQRVLTVMAAKVGLDGNVSVDLELAPPDVIETSSMALKLVPSRRRDDVLRASVKVTAGPNLGATLLTARVGQRSADCVIEVVEPEAAPEPIAPTDLEFERPHYRLVLGKPKALRIRAPLGGYPDGVRIRITSSSRGTVVLDGGEVSLESRPGALAMEGVLRVEGRAEQDKATLTATDPAGHQAVATAQVVSREESGADFETKLVPEYQGDQRAQWSGDYRLLRIMGEHPAVKPYLGDKEAGYPGQTSPQFRLMMAELVADAVVRRILLGKYGEDEVDAGTFYVQQYKLIARFLARAHRLVAATA
jgi:hypothetical protein